MSDSLHSEVEKFRQWASDYPIETRSGEWECDYDKWDKLNQSFLTHLKIKSPAFATTEDISDLIYTIARDNEMEELISEVENYTEWFKLLLRHVIACDEPDAKWQFSVAIGHGTLPFAEAEQALLKLVNDRNEYVSRMALRSLAQIGSSYTESYCERAWETNHEYQRIMALWALKEIGSSKLVTYLERAIEDGRKYVVSNAQEIKNA